MVIHNLAPIQVDPSSLYVTECPACHGEITIEYIEMTHTKSMIRKATCKNSKCAMRIFARAMMAKSEADPIAHSMGGKIKLFCNLCNNQTNRLYMHSAGLVCKSCAMGGLSILGDDIV